MSFTLSRRRMLALAATVAAPAGAISWLASRPGSTGAPRFTFYREHVLGTSLEVTVLADSEAAAESIEAAIVDAIAEDAAVLSGYDASSEFSRWLRTAHTPTHVSPLLMEVLGLFETWHARTGGAIDAASERVSQVWRTAASEGRVPTAEERRLAVADVQQAHWRLDAAAGTATRLSQTPLILNSFTKIFIVDRAAAAGLKAGARGVVVNIGGDIAVRGDVTEVVGIRDPRVSADNGPLMTSIEVGGLAVATSGGYRRGFDVSADHYSHIIDPRTGDSTGHVLGVTVVAPNAVDAGALATAMCVLRPDEGARLAGSVPGAEYLLVTSQGSRVESDGWQRLEVRETKGFRAPEFVTTLYAAEQTWDPQFELTVSLDLARVGRRPYVAVWIEDKDRFPVKTLALWFEKARWLPDLRAWYRADRLRSLAEGTNIVNTVASATRAPGRYTLTWDGKDQQGKPVKPGVYTVLIEAAREHGTYQLMRQEMDLSGTPKKVDLAGNIEIAAASLDYHRR